MQMRMKVYFLTPGMQDAEKTNLGSKVLFNDPMLCDGFCPQSGWRGFLP